MAIELECDECHRPMEIGCYCPGCWDKQEAKCRDLQDDLDEAQDEAAFLKERVETLERELRDERKSK